MTRKLFLVDPASKDIYIFSKNDNPSRIYRLAYPYGTTNTATYVSNLTYSGVVSAALSGNEIIIKTYSSLYYYKRSSGQSIEQVLQTTPVLLKYTLEPQGEALSFANDGSGFFTLSEKGFASFVNLYFYKRN